MPISVKDLFLGFLKIGMMGFGGVATIARHVIVVDRGWMDDREYAALLGFGQVLPGANVTNMAIILGRRHAGLAGIIASVGGLLLVPLLSLLVLSALYERAAANPHVSQALAAMASAAGGLLVGTAIKSARKAKLEARGALVALAGFVAIVIGKLPMVWVLLSLLPVSVYVAWRRSRPS